jgi:hypothetical protein
MFFVEVLGGLFGLGRLKIKINFGDIENKLFWNMKNYGNWTGR